MTKITKTCVKHGVLEEENIVIEKDKTGLKGILSFRCRLCKREKDARWKEANREKHRKSANKKRNENREWFNEKMRNKKLGILPPVKISEPYKELKEGEILTIDNMNIYSYKKMLKEQKGKCKICKKKETRIISATGENCRLVIDHCHETGGVRGLLCSNCNFAIANFKHSPELISKAIEYIEYHRKRQNE